MNNLIFPVVDRTWEGEGARDPREIASLLLLKDGRGCFKFLQQYGDSYNGDSYSQVYWIGRWEIVSNNNVALNVFEVRYKTKESDENKINDTYKKNERLEFILNQDETIKVNSSIALTKYRLIETDTVSIDMEDIKDGNYFTIPLNLPEFKIE